MMFLLAVVSCIALAQAQHHEDIYRHPHPYEFGYEIKDHHSEQHRQETGNGHGAVAGSYGFTDARGIARQVHYVADHAGFRAQVRTNEPGTANQNPAAVHVVSHQPHAYRVVEPHHAHPVEVVVVPVAPTAHGLHHDLGHGYGHNGAVNFAVPLIGGAVRGYDSRFVNVAL